MWNKMQGNQIRSNQTKANSNELKVNRKSQIKIKDYNFCNIKLNIQMINRI